jgi:hypothetical protein
MWAKINAFMLSVYSSVSHFHIFIPQVYILVFYVHTLWFKFIFSPIMLSFQGLEFTESFTHKRRKDPMESLLFVLQNQLPRPTFL